MALSRAFFDDDFMSPFLSHWPVATQGAGRSQESVRGIALDVKEDDKGFHVSADVPGMDKNDIKVNVDGDVLSIAVEKSTHKKEDKEEQGVKWHRVERSSTFAQRRLRLPDSADLPQISAKYEDGVLRLDIPKHEKKTKQPLAINVQ